MFKSITVFFSAISLLAGISFAQSGTDPIHWTAPIKVKSDNIFLLRSQENQYFSAAISHQKVFRFIQQSTNLPASQRLSATVDHVDSTTNVSGGQQMDVAAGYLTTSPYENAVAAWEGPNQTIQLMIPHFDSTANAWSSSSEMTVPGPATGRIYVRTGDFLGNGLDQVVLAYEGLDSSIHLQVYSVDDSLDPHLIASINDVKWTGFYPINQFSVTTGDLNGNGKDEIILSYRDVSDAGRGAIYAKVYEVRSNSILPEASQEIIQESNVYPNLQNPEFGITAGHFEGDSLDQVALVWAANQSDGNNAYVLTYFLQGSSNLSSITFDPSKVDSMYIGTGGNLTDFSIASGDLDNGGRDELVYDLDDEVYVDSTDNSLSIARVTNFGALSGGPDDDQLSYDFLAVGELDQNGPADIVVEKDIYGNAVNQYVDLEAYELTQDLTKDSVIAYEYTDTTDNGGAGSYHSAIALGTFDGSEFTIEAPTFYQVNNVVQPIVVLNTPPVHFDILNGTTYDLSNNFSGAPNTSFFSSYQQQTSTSTTLVLQTQNDVSDAAGVDLSGSVSVGSQDGVNLGAEATVSVSVAANFELKVEGTWGHSFSSNSSSTHTKTLSLTYSAMGDDQIYATTTSYNLWVYPVYDGNDPKPVDYINFASPIETHGTWYPSKTYVTNNYIPNHELGNVLSYLPSDSAMNNPNIESSLVSVSQSYGLGISGEGTSSWNLSQTNYSQSTFDSTWSSGWDVNINVGLTFSSTGDNVNETTNTTSMLSGWDLSAHFGTIVDSLGNAASYTVTPYAYRSKQGAIVLSYAVDPDVASPGQPSTWWQQEYGHYSDPTFILPWFYSRQEGSPADTVKKDETTDIYFSNNSPQPGDTITITARVRNFSLVPTPIPVTVKFYVGDPDSGGTVITGVNGVDSVVTASTIASRYWSDVSMRWVFPSGLPQYPRIYAVIDPSNQIKEVHENNNMGWAVLGQQSNNTVSGIVQSKPVAIPTTAKLYQSYPNPFNPTAQIEYSIPRQGLVTITIYNILGERVETLFSGMQSAGMHEVTFNGERFASGVYFYHLQAGAYSLTKKMMLLK